jgi:hypothetical protein
VLRLVTAQDGDGDAPEALTAADFDDLRVNNLMYRVGLTMRSEEDPRVDELVQLLVDTFPDAMARFVARAEAA